MPTAIDVAARILAERGGMDSMKLQRLVYYSQAWTLVWTGEPLFDDPIEAWANGPVVRSLFARHRGRYNVLPSDVGGNPEALSANQKASVALIADHYGKWTGRQLNTLAHSERPWLEAREGLAPTERGDRKIDPLVMADFYGAMARNANSG